MQSVKAFCLLCFLIIFFPVSIFAQETFVPEKIYFQNEVIRKVSVGEGGVWVIKGVDSTGVGKLEPEGKELDYTQTVNSAFPLTGIVGKYGDSAMIATKGNYLLMYDKGKVSRLDEENGIMGRYINSIGGSSYYTSLATNAGPLESYNNNNFIQIPETAKDFDWRGTQHVIRLPKTLILTHCKNADCNNGSSLDEYVYGGLSNTYRDKVGTPASNKLLAISSNDEVDWYRFMFYGDISGLWGRHSGLGVLTHFLEDTTVYSIVPFDSLMLIGTEKGLYYCVNRMPNNVSKIDLGGNYQIFDIQVDSFSKTIWLATDNGLLKLKYNYTELNENFKDEEFTWFKKIGDKYFAKASSSSIDKEGNQYTTGSYLGMVNFGDSTLLSQNGIDFFLAKYNPDGNLIWIRSAVNTNSSGGAIDEEPSAIRVNSKGETYIILASNSRSNIDSDWRLDFGGGSSIPINKNDRLKVIKYDKEGNFKWAKPLEFYKGMSRSISFEIDLDDNLYIAVPRYTQDLEMRIIKFDSELEVMWDKTIEDGYLDYFKLLESGAFYLSGHYYDNFQMDQVHLENRNQGSSCIVYFDKSGTAIWGKDFKNTPTFMITKTGEDRQGNLFFSGYLTDRPVQIENYTVQRGLFLSKVNPAGEVEWLINFPELSYSHHFEVDSLGYSYLGGSITGDMVIGDSVILDYNEGKTESYVIKFDPFGKISWTKRIFGENVSLLRKLNQLFISSNFTELEQNYLIAKFRDTTSYLERNLVSGKAFHDKNKNNLFDQEDVPVRSNVMKATPGPHYARSNEDGEYFFYLPKGNFTIEQIIPEYKGKIITQTFPAQPYQLELTGTEVDTAGFDFAHDVQLSPHLSVDVSSSRFRRCFKNTTVVEYCNEGFAAAENVQIELEYPDYVIPVSSDFPWSSKSGRKIIFNIGTLQPQQCKRITLTDSVMCGNEGIRGLTQCIKARITPIAAPPPHPDWDQSDIVLSAECRDNGFVRLNLQNNGNGDMADSAVFKIFLKDELAYAGKYKLKKGDNMGLNVLADGKPLHFEVELSPFHPEKRSVSISINGCDEDGNPRVQHTFTNQFPQNDNQHHYEISCLEIIDSYDPNDKQVIPAGISANHYVEEGSLLEYTIRFQNTGTDTAYTVVITDLLDPMLDISTLNVGLSSHLVKWEISGEGQANISWRFSNINLPDSTTNEKASHGFVKFKIRPIEEAGFGTAIKNKAAIYFDYNSPIITNETLTTLGIPESPSEEKLVFQNCNVAVSLAQEENVELVLCGSSSMQLSRQAPGPGRGRWKVVKGQAKIADPYKHITTVEDLSYGENIFEWEVSYCDVLVRSLVKVKREALPAAPEIIPLPVLCEDDPLPTITAIGAEIEWYADEALTQLMGKGNTFQVKDLASGRIYVTQQNTLCKSQASIVVLNVHPKPAPPVASSVEACLETEKVIKLSAKGNNLRWYADQALENLLGEGESFQPKEIGGSQTYFVTQSSDYCESDAAKVVLNTKTFDASKALFANVITPNGDDWNQFFYVNPFETEECLGNFIAVKIYNRMGKLLFQSSNRRFQWDATKVNAGIYFYSMEYELRKFNGSIQVLQ